MVLMLLLVVLEVVMMPIMMTSVMMMNYDDMVDRSSSGDAGCDADGCDDEFILHLVADFTVDL